MTKFFRDSLESEFLTQAKGSGEVKVYEFEGLGIVAESLCHLDILADNPVAVGVKGIYITVPEPAAYVIQKLVINHKRPENKREKDLRAVEELLPIVRDSNNQKLLLESIYTTGLTRSERQAVDRICEENFIMLF